MTSTARLLGLVARSRTMKFARNRTFAHLREIEMPPFTAESRIFAPPDPSVPLT
jgi:hypothetical protein